MEIVARLDAAMPQIGRAMRLHPDIAVIVNLAKPAAREAVSGFLLASPLRDIRLPFEARRLRLGRAQKRALRPAWRWMSLFVHEDSRYIIFVDIATSKL
jgi:hypothetical protein